MSKQVDIAVIDSGGANIASVMFALERLDRKGVLTSDADLINNAAHVILPGVGAAADAMKSLNSVDGLVDCITTLKQPVLGICLGMQLLYDYSEEGGVDMLGIVNGEISRFADREGMPVPHMGWNSLEGLSEDHPLLKDLEDQAHCYFVHSYKAPISKETIAGSFYGESFTSIVSKDNFMGCQFHPERSGASGSQILKNFLNL